MTKYTVTSYQTITQRTDWLVDADNKEDARNKILNGEDGEILDTDTDDWKDLVIDLDDVSLDEEEEQQALEVDEKVEAKADLIRKYGE